MRGPGLPLFLHAKASSLQKGHINLLEGEGESAVRRKRRWWIWVVLALAGLTALLLVITEVNVRPIILSMAESRVRAIALDAINTAIQQNLQDVSYENLVQPFVDAEGRVTMLKANTIAMNELATSTALTAQQYIADIEMQPIRVSLGSASGNPLLAGRGPSMLVKVVPAGSVSSEFLTEFTSAGINQTRHRIYMQLSATVRIVIPTGAKLVEVLSLAPIAETVIVGNVPDSFVNVEEVDDMLNLIPDSPKELN